MMNRLFGWNPQVLEGRATGKAADLDDAPGPKAKDSATGRSFELAWFRWDVVGTSFRLGQGMVQNDYPNHHDSN